MKNSSPSKDRTIIILLLFLTLWVRSSTQMMIHTGVDERDYWYAAKTLVLGYEYPDLTHRTVRWSIIVPTAILQLIFGTHPNIYYLGPLINALIQTLVLYCIGRDIRGRMTGIVAAIFLIFFPYQIRAASQIRPEIFSITYIALCMYFLIRFIKKENRLINLVLSSLFLFLAYMAKITNLFFLPGIIIALLLYEKEHRLRNVVAYGGVLLLLYLAETASYAVFSSYDFGRLSIISSNHLSSDYTVPLMKISDLLKRYSTEYLDAYWSVSFIAFAFAAAYCYIRSKDRAIRIIIVMTASFFFFITFTVSSLNPLLPAEDFINRYFCAVLPSVFLVLASVLESLFLKHIPMGFRRPRYLFIFICVSCLSMSILFAWSGIPEKHRPYAHSPLQINDHPYIATHHFYQKLNNAWNTGVLIASVDTPGGNNALMTVAYFFINGPAPEARILHVGDAALKIISKNGSFGTDVFVAAVRNPFRIRELPFDALYRIESDHLPD